MKTPILILIIFILQQNAFAQAKKNPTDTIPQFFVTFGNLTSGSFDPEQLKKNIDSAITVKDKKGYKYPIVRFRINYSFTNSFRDSETELLKKVRDFRAADFYDTAFLSTNWAESIKDNAKKGDEILINNIIFKYKNGKKIMAPDWNAIIK
jgi:hypothetical protein